jgi:hypothetical protein
MNQAEIKRRMLFLIFPILIGSLIFINSGCSILKRDKQSVAEKKQAAADKKATEEYEKARKQHYKNQTKEARKMMKQTKKEAGKINKPLRKRGLKKTKCQ